MNLFWAISAASLLAGTVFVYVRTRTLSRESASGQLDLTPESIAELPDRIQLTPLPAGSMPSTVTATVRDLCEQGFEDAGAFTVEGLPGTTVQLLAHRAHSMYAALWQSERAGSWVDLSTNYPGGHTCTFTTLTGTGLEGRPGHTIVRAPAMRPLDLFLRHSSERAMGVFRPASPQQAVTEIENAYMLWRAWRRAQNREREFEAA